MGEGEPISDVVATAFDVLGAQALARLCNEEGNFSGYELDGPVIR
jgi:hypothetical protein